jgi:DNA-directed RNA polymerase specialized sigma subunit, sigma24 homolog
MPLDKLEQLLVDNSPQVLLRKLEGDTIREDRRYYRDTERIRGKLTDYIKVPRDPLDYLVEQEEKQEILAVVQKIYRELPQELSEVFQLMVIKGYTKQAASDFLGVSLATVYRRLDRLQEELKKYRSELTIETHESTLEAKAPRDFIRYACEFYKDYYEGKVNRQGNYITHCRIQRYFDESFGDDKTTCGMCDKCSNGFMRKRRDCK